MSRPNGTIPPASASQASGAARRGTSSQGTSRQQNAASPAPPGKPGRPQRPASTGRPVPSGPPSWASVIATTVRLWFQRRVRHDADPRAGSPADVGSATASSATVGSATASSATVGLGSAGSGSADSGSAPSGRAPSGTGAGAGGTASGGAVRKAPRHRAAIFGLAIVVFAAGALTIALAEHQGASHPVGPAQSQTAPGGTGAVQAATAVRNAAAAWVVAQVGHDVTVACDPAMCTRLEADGFPAGDLLPVTAQSSDTMGSQVVIATATLRSQFGSRLPDIYAPAVIARFGTGASRVDIRVAAPDGAQAYLVTQRADLLARQAAGRQLLRNPLLHVSGASRQALLGGRVDPRLLITLAALTAQRHIVYISRFGDAGPGAGTGVPLRMMRISALVAGKHGRHKDAYLHSVLAFLRAQRPPYLATAAVLRPALGATVIQVQFAAPSPLGLLGAHPAS